MNRMRKPNWCRSKYLVFAALVLWALAPIWVSHAFPHRPVLGIATEVLLSAALLVYLAWVEGWRKLLLETLPYFVMIGALIWAQGAFQRSYGALTGSFYTLLVMLAASILYVFFLSLVGARPKDDLANTESWAEIWAAFRAILLTWPSWAQVRAEVRAERLLPKIKLVWVQAADLAGVVEYDSMHFAGVRVEECSDDWAQQLSEVKTDDNGRFTLPRISDDPTHWVRVSWPGTRMVYLRVELSPGAPPLHIHLKYRIRTSTNYWPGPPIESPNLVRNG